ncbi:MAG: hypothetical protein OQK82_06735 [Candidatus Pacearchaeota archaeon]|nr:hypothetical protein [Candidatus Pacearchaeota archaeon]
MKNKNIFGIMSFAVVVMLMISFVSAMDSYSKSYSESYEDIQKAIEDNNYEEWKNLIVATLTEENFERLVEEKRNQEDFNALTEKLIDAWENGDKDRVEEIQEALEKLSREIYGENAEFMASDGSFALSVSDDGNEVYVSNVPEGIEIESSYGAVHLSESEPCKVGEECEAERIEIEANLVGKGVSPEGVNVVSVKDSRSFWDAFRFW